jgi:hypothetical protein
VGDILYMGSTVGPFNNVVFDIGTIAADVTLVWEYWNGSWVTITAPSDFTTSLTLSGIRNFSFQAYSDWVTNNPGMGTTGYWIRARVSAIGGSPVAPTQQNRVLYTPITPYVEISEDDVVGDLPLLAKITLHSKSDWSTGVNVRYTNRVILGTRSLDRGYSFSPYINIADEQNQTGITVASGTGTADADDYRTPTGRTKIHTCTGAGTWQDIVTITLANSIAADFLGRFHAFVRARQSTVGAIGNLRMRLVFRVGSGTSSAYISNEAGLYSTDIFNLIDFGNVVMPSFPELIQVDSVDTITITIQGLSTAASGAIAFQDLVIMPIDECAVDTYDSEKSLSNSIRNGYPLEMDAISYLKGRVRSSLKTSAGRHVNEWLSIAPDGITLQAKKNQRIWFLFSAYVSSVESSRSWIVNTVFVEIVQRYLGMRGRN